MNKTITAVVAVIVVGGLSFWGGMKYQEGKMPAFARGTNGANFAARFGANGGAGAPGAAGAAGRGFGGGASGTVISSDATSITVKSANGSTRIVYVTGSTTYFNEVKGAATDVKVGSTISVVGTPNSDGSEAATSVRIQAQ